MTVPGLVPLVSLVGDGALVPCVDGQERPYLSCDAAASTPAFPSVLAAVEDFLPWYSSVHRGAGYKSQRSTDAYEGARDAALRFAHRQGDDDVAIICRNTTEAINHLAYRLRFSAESFGGARRRRRPGGRAGAPAAGGHGRLQHHRVGAAGGRAGGVGA